MLKGRGCEVVLFHEFNLLFDWISSNSSLMSSSLRHWRSAVSVGRSSFVVSVPASWRRRMSPLVSSQIPVPSASWRIWSWTRSSSSVTTSHIRTVSLNVTWLTAIEASLISWRIISSVRSASASITISSVSWARTSSNDFHKKISSNTYEYLPLP